MASDLNRANKTLVLILGLLLGVTVRGAKPGALPDGHDLTSPELLERKQDLQQSIKALKRSQGKFERFMAEGRIRTTLCRNCHGEYGVSTMPGVPSLAGQNPVYLVEQLERFADGRRSEFLMSGLAKSLSERDRLRLAVYYASLAPAPPVAADPELVARGAALYRSGCVRCHGADGRGERGYARLAGQRSDYVVKRLQQFRERTAAGADARMSAQPGALRDEDIEAVAAYVGTLP